jgi:hypothetical protein
MATPDFYYYWMWKSITFNGSTLFTAYWADLSPQHPTFSWSWNQLKATGERDFNCSWFQVGNSVLAYTWTYVSWEVAGSATIDIYLFTLGWTRLAYERHISTGSLVANWVARYYTEIAIMDWQIRDYSDDYRLYFQSTHSAWYSTTKYLDFSVSSMYADTEEYEPWVFTVRWTDLVYTDYWWYSHHIQYDGNYSWSYVGTSNSWKIWVQNWVARRLYYVDANGYVRRTYEADNRYWSTSWQWVNVWSQYAWALRTWWAWASWASGRYLCFVNSSWYKMRIMNWNPNDF